MESLRSEAAQARPDVETQTKWVETERNMTRAVSMLTNLPADVQAVAGAGAARQALYDYLNADEGGKAAALGKAAEQLRKSVSLALESEGLDKWTRQRLERMLDNIDSKGEMGDNRSVIKDSREIDGIPKTKVDEIIGTPKGSRPDPTKYLSTEYIENHLSKFKDGVTKIVAQAPIGTAGPPSGTFVMPSSVADNLIIQAEGDISKLEKILGLPQGSLGTSPVRIDVVNPTGLRLPSGNELGANNQWIPGGYTAGGLLEAIIDSPKIGQYIINPIK